MIELQVQGTDTLTRMLLMLNGAAFSYYAPVGLHIVSPISLRVEPERPFLSVSNFYIGHVSCEENWKGTDKLLYPTVQPPSDFI
jgi:hypothetical protein